MNHNVEQWLARARTPETRARIHRWAIVSRALFAVMVASAVGFVVAIAAFIVLALVGGDPPWWGLVVALGVLLVAIIAWCLAAALLEAAGYLDGDEAVGTITEVSADDSMGPESNPLYHIAITAELASGERIYRATREYPRDEPRPGQKVRFLHNTCDPDELEDILLLKFVDEHIPSNRHRTRLCARQSRTKQAQR